MEKIEFKLDGPSVIGPRRGCILLARFQLVGRQQELGSIFCDYGMLAGRSLQLFNCRAKTFLMDCPVPCDYALESGRHDRCRANRWWRSSNCQRLPGIIGWRRTLWPWRGNLRIWLRT